LAEAFAGTGSNERNLTLTIGSETEPGSGKFIITNDYKGTDPNKQWWLIPASLLDQGIGNSGIALGNIASGLFPNIDFVNPDLNKRRLAGQVVNVEVKNKSGKEIEIGFETSVMPVPVKKNSDTWHVPNPTQPAGPKPEIKDTSEANLAEVAWLTVVKNTMNGEKKNETLIDDWLSSLPEEEFYSLGYLRVNNSVNISFIMTMWPDAGNDYQNLPVGFDVNITQPSRPPVPTQTPSATKAPSVIIERPQSTTAPVPSQTPGAAKASPSPAAEPSAEPVPSIPLEPKPEESEQPDDQDDRIEEGSLSGEDDERYAPKPGERPAPPPELINAYPDYTPLPLETIEEAETPEDFYFLYQNDTLAHGVVEMPFEDWLVLNSIVLPTDVVASLSVNKMPQTGEPSLNINVVAGMILMAGGVQLLRRAKRPQR
jgi:hypothetical protein